MTPQRALGQILVRHGAVTPEALEPLYTQQLDKPRGLVELVLESKLASERTVAMALAAECRLPFVEKIDIDAVVMDVTMRVPITYAKNHALIVMESARSWRSSALSFDTTRRRRARDVP